MNASTHEFHPHEAEALNSLLRGELSAVETYTQALLLSNEASYVN